MKGSDMQEETIKSDVLDTTVVAPATDTTSESTVAAPAVKKRKIKRSVPYGQVHVQSTFNNTIITFADANGGVLAASSAGACGFRGSKKGDSLCRTGCL